MYISIKRHSWFFKSWWCLLYFGHVQTRTIGKCWRQKTPFCLKLSAHAQWRQKPPFCLKLSTHAQESVLSWSISMSRILDTVCWISSWQWHLHAFYWTLYHKLCVNLPRTYTHSRKTMYRHACTGTARLLWHHYQGLRLRFWKRAHPKWLKMVQNGLKL